jgi:hypothetical protein
MTGLGVQRLAFWIGQNVDVVEYVRKCHSWMICLDWIAWLLTTAIGFDVIQNHVDLLSGKV